MINQSRLASMGEMIGNISHQWRQPLAQISSTLVNLELYSERGKLSQQRLKEAIEEANEQVKFMSGTIEDFKNFFNPNMPKSEFEVKQAIEQACKILNATLKKHVIDVKVEIKTGRTHQIRVHLNHAGYGIVGDEKYAKNKSARMYLHAYKIELLGYKFRSNLSSDFNRLGFEISRNFEI